MKKIFRFIGAIFKGIWKVINIIRLAIYNLFFFFILGLIYIAYTHTNTEAPLPLVQDSSALVLNLSGPIVEQSSYTNPIDSVSGSLFGQELPKENILFNVVETIRHAADDDLISGLVLRLGQLPETNLTKLRYIGKALKEFKATGKPIYAVGDYYNQSQYYLASYADKIYLAPDGAVLLQGYGSYPLYYKDLLDTLDITTHIFRVGTYKSAVEPFLRNDMSTAAKESASSWLNQLWHSYLADVAENRQIDAESFSPSMDIFLQQLKAVDGDLARLTLKLGIVDELATRQQVRQAMLAEFGAQADGGFQDSFKAVGFYQYSASIGKPVRSSSNDIAVIVASGTIMDGVQPRGTIGGDTTASLLRRARDNKKVKAVVIRVDSPGGSAFASEVIRNEIEALKAAGKPVVVSMSSVAASGGYWLATAADQIIAQPTTLTGSIGIFSVITTFENTLDDIGINSDGVGTTPFMGLGLTTGIPEQAAQALQLGIEHGYQRFLDIVATSRGMSVAEVDAIAQGRVWTGLEAQQLGLVDQLGDFDSALQAAAELAAIEDYNIFWVTEPLSRTEEILQQLMENVHTSVGLDLRTLMPSSLIDSDLIPKALQPIANQVMADSALLNSLNDPKGYYTLCLTCQIE